MAAITAALIKQVREDTGAGMLDVKKALTEAEGDVARAKEIIRAKGIAAAGKREGRKAQEGTIASKVVETANGETGYAVELNSETDFVAKTPKFVEFTEEVLGYAVDADANSADELLEAKAGDTTVKLAVEEAAAADVVFVCLGAPKQELWMVEHGPATGAHLMVGLGGSLDVFAGVVERAPEGFQKLGLEWLYRLAKEPKRIGRMAKLPLVLVQAAGARLRGK